VLPLLQQGKGAGLLRPYRPQFWLQSWRNADRAKKTLTRYVSTAKRCGFTSGSLSPTLPSFGPKGDGEKIAAFSLKKHAGIQGLGRSWQWSLRASVTPASPMTDCHIPAENLPLPNVEGLKARWAASIRRAMGLDGAHSARPWLATTQLSAIPGQRKQFRNQPIASHQLVQEKRRWMITRNHQGTVSRSRSDALRTLVRVHHSHISMLKMNNVRSPSKRPHGFVTSSCQHRGRLLCMRPMNNLESCFTYEGTDDIRSSSSANVSTGIFGPLITSKFPARVIVHRTFCGLDYFLFIGLFSGRDPAPHTRIASRDILLPLPSLPLPSGPRFAPSPLSLRWSPTIHRTQVQQTLVFLDGPPARRL